MLQFLTEIFCYIDDFCKWLEQEYESYLLTNSKVKKPLWNSSMSLSEVMTILVLFHNSHYRDFKTFYLANVCIDHKNTFRLVSYTRFVELIKLAMMPLFILAKGLRGEETGIYIVDSTAIEVCNIKREKINKVFKGIAKKGKTTMGWFFGFKLHLIINNKGEIMNFHITTGNISDINPVLKLTDGLKGWLFGDKGYISSTLLDTLKENLIEIFTKVKKNMKEKFMTPIQKSILKKRGVVETVIGQLKGICQIEHSRHRSPVNAMTNIAAVLVAYFFKKRKPSIKIPAKYTLGYRK